MTSTLAIWIMYLLPMVVVLALAGMAVAPVTAAAPAASALAALIALPTMAVSAAVTLRGRLCTAFSAMEAPPRDRGEALVRRAAILLPAGAVGDFIPSSTGGFFVHVLSRQAAKPEDVANRLSEVKQGLLQMRRQQMVADFQQAALREAFGESLGGRKQAEAVIPVEE